MRKYYDFSVGLLLWNHMGEPLVGWGYNRVVGKFYVEGEYLINKDGITFPEATSNWGTVVSLIVEYPSSGRTDVVELDKSVFVYQETSVYFPARTIGIPIVITEES